MIKNWKAAIATLVFCATSFGAGAVFTSGAQARGEWGSSSNVFAVRNRLGGLVDQLQRDNRDYGGHRVAAISDMERAQAELNAALQYDASHPGR